MPVSDSVKGSWMWGTAQYIAHTCATPGEHWRWIPGRAFLWRQRCHGGTPKPRFFLMMGHICWMILGDMIYSNFHVLLGDIGFHHVSPNPVTKYPSTKVEQPACAKSPWSQKSQPRLLYASASAVAFAFQRSFFQPTQWDAEPLT